MALDGKIEFLKKTNPFGSSESDKEAEKLASAPNDPAAAMEKLMGFARRDQRRRMRDKSNKG